MEAIVERHIELDHRLVDAVSRVRLLQAVAWPARVRDDFLAAWRRGEPKLPNVSYTPLDLCDVHAELKDR